MEDAMGKPVVYQVFTRLFGNTQTTNTPWGTIEENGVGKFNDFTDEALQGLESFNSNSVTNASTSASRVAGSKVVGGDVVEVVAGNQVAVR